MFMYIHIYIYILISYVFMPLCVEAQVDAIRAVARVATHYCGFEIRDMHVVGPCLFFLMDIRIAFCRWLG